MAPQNTDSGRDTDPHRDWDEASHAVSDAYFRHALHPQGAGTTAEGVTVDGVGFGPVRIAHIGWGASVTVDTSHEGAYAVNVPLSGLLESRIGHEDLVATPDSATVYPPDTPVRIVRWDAACRIVGVRFDRDYLHREVTRLLGTPRAVPEDLRIDSPEGAQWLSLVESVSRLQVHSDMVAEQLSGAVTAAFVLAAIPEDAASGSRPRIVKRVLDLMNDDPARPWTAADMAEVAGVGIRRLQEGFREYVGASPRDVLTGIRLDRVRADLIAGPAPLSVTEVAMRWGFTHTGRFAAAYRRRFGESPSETAHR